MAFRPSRATGRRPGCRFWGIPQGIPRWFSNFYTTDLRSTGGAPGAFLRGSFNRSVHRSALVRLLSEGSGIGAAAPAGQDFAERLGGWLNVADAIELRAALQSLGSPRARSVARPAAAVTLASTVSLDEELERVRATLTQSILSTEPAQPPRGRADRSAHAALAAPALPLDPAAEYAMLHQRYIDQQRRMEMSVDALRSHARERLAAASPELAQLAALDAVMDQMLGGREQHLLSTVPAFLKKRFEQLRREAPADTDPPAWLTRLTAECQQALLAELDLRLQPIAGMAEALAQASH
jgi:hypothetical protein